MNNAKHFLVVSKKSNTAKYILAVDANHAKNLAAALIWPGGEHRPKDFKIKKA